MTLKELLNLISDIRFKHMQAQEEETKNALTRYKRELPFHVGNRITYDGIEGVITKVEVWYRGSCVDLQILLKGGKRINIEDPDKVYVIK